MSVIGVDPNEPASKARALADSQGWNYQDIGQDQLKIETCPLCSNTNWKFFMNVCGGEKDGLYDCKVCSATGNLFKLKKELGVSMSGATSLKDAVSTASSPSPLPNLLAMHKQLLDDPEFGDVLDYALTERHLSVEIIEKFKIGADLKDGVKWLVVPYMDAAGKFIFYKKRSLPEFGKLFAAPAGREASLFNSSCLSAGMDELIMCEGELDALALLSKGVEGVVGVPGAALKKASWLEKLDKVKPKNIFTLYDNDKAGTEGAKELANRVGIDLVRNIALPAFSWTDDEGVEHTGKDVTDWFTSGRSLGELILLKMDAKLFAVDGIVDVESALGALEDLVLGVGLEPKYKSPWPSLNKRYGGMEPGDLIGVMAEGKVGKSTMALNWAQYFAELGETPLFYCQEMLPARLVRKWVSMVTKTDDTPGASKIDIDTINAARKIALEMKGDMLFGYTRSNDPKDVMETIRRTYKRYGSRIIVFDNLQLLVRSIENGAAETSKLTKMFKSLAMELGAVIILIIQPKRVSDGSIISARDAMGSSAIEKDVDTMICLHRNRVGQLKKADDFKGFQETEENFEPIMLVRVDLSRYAAGGACTLYFDGKTSEVRELGPSDLSAVSNTSLIIQTEPVSV
jgi:5S rRNA maturation endonuclease (ribonuclease M5)/KaiC/GvpD/RAD55 family RecA-like ATPase